MKKFLATVFIVAIVLYFGNQFAASQLQAEDQIEPEPKQNLQEVYGKIRQANGNEIVVALGSLPSANRGGAGADLANASGGATEDAGAGEARARPSETQGDGSQMQGEAPAETQRDSSQPSGESTSGERPSGGQFSGEQSLGSQPSSAPEAAGSTGRGMGASTRGAMTMNATSIELTGAEQTFLIPVTAKITTGNGDNERTVRFTQLAYKNVVKLTLNENGDVVAVNVLS